MEKLIDLLNQYEESMIDKDLEEEEDWIIEYGKVRTEFNWHLRFNNANTVQFPDEMFDYYALSMKYRFIRWLIKNWYTTLEHWSWFQNTVSEKSLITICAVSDDPIQTLLTYLK